MRRLYRRLASDAGTLYVARTPDFGVRGSSLAKTTNLKEGCVPSGSGAQVQGRTADLNGGGLRYARFVSKVIPRRR